MSSGSGRVRRRAPVKRVLRPIQDFTEKEASSGIVLLIVTVVALIWANSPLGDSYVNLWRSELTIGLGDYSLSKDLTLWINDGLMAVFFLVVGLEIKREILVGELSSPRHALLPIAAAVGGAVVPAGIYIALNAGTEGAAGWGIPMATDIAFALGILALLGSRAPLSLKVFLTALAIVDDLMAVMVIAFFYTAELSWISLAIGAGFMVGLMAVNVAGIRRPFVYALLGIGLWLALLQSGIHATIAGVLLALTIPSRARIDTEEFVDHSRKIVDHFERSGERGGSVITNQERQGALHELESAAERVQPPLQRMEHALLPWVAFAIMPLFALANAGVPLLGGDLAATLTNPVSLGIMAGLVVGKQLGITVFAWVAVKSGLSELPADLGWRHIYGAGWLAGIGFTMSLFIADLAFPDDPLLDVAKLGVLTASLVAGVVGWVILRSAGSSPPAAPERA